MDCSFKATRRRGKKLSAWSSLTSGGGTIFDIFGVASQNVHDNIGRSLKDDSKKLRDDARAIGRDFAHVLRSVPR